MPDRTRTWGFRCSTSDVLVVMTAVPTTWMLWRSVGAIAGIVPMAVGHFFLFCNVFRVHRTKELLWALAAIMNVAAWVAADRLDWLGILISQTPVTIAVIASEMAGRWYHGVFADRINRRLGDYLSGALDARLSETAP